MAGAFERAAQMEIFDHFGDVNALDKWNTHETDANGDVTLQTNGRAGVVNINAGTTLDEEAYLFSNEVFKFNGDLPIGAQGRMIGDADTAGAYSWIFGIAEESSIQVAGTSQDLIVDGGLTLAADWEGCLFFKPYNTNVISVVTCSTASTEHKTDVTQFTQTADPGSPVPFVSMQLEVMPHSDAYFEVIYRFDERGGLGFQPCRRASDNQVIKHIVSFDPSGKMSLVAGLKNGKAAEDAILRIDYMGAVHQAHRKDT